MLTSIKNVQTEVFKILNANGSYSIPNGAAPLIIPVHYARKSALTNAENVDEQYPNISLLDYLPEFSDEWKQNFQERVDGFHDFDVVTGLPDKAYVYKEPVMLLFKYDFTAYTKSPVDRITVDDYFLKTFGQTGAWCLNKITLVEGDEGDFVTYSVIRTEVTRTDGITEINYEISFKTLVHITDPVEVDLITNFNINLNNVNI